MMKRLLILLILLVPAGMQCAWASCGSASCPLNMNQYLGHGVLQVGLMYEYINQDQIYLGRHKSFVGAIPEDHDEVQTINERSTNFTTA